MAPVLDQVAPQVAGQMAIGSIDCTTQKAICDEHKVKAFPTLKFYKDGQFFDYPGGRKEHEIKSFAQKMSQPAVKEVQSVEAVLEVAQQSDPSVAFMLYDASMMTKDDEKKKKLVDQLQSTPMGRVYNQVARKQQAMASFTVWSGGDALNLGDNMPSDKPFVVKMEEGVEPVFWSPDNDNDDDSSISSVALIQFVKENNINLVSEFGPSNFHKIGQLGRSLVIGAVDAKKEEDVQVMVEQLTTYAKTGLLRNDYYFGYMDGKTWHKFLSQFQVNDLPQVFVLHVPTKTYYQNETYYAANGMDGFLNAIDSGVLPKLNRGSDRGWKGLADTAQLTFFRYMPWSMVALIVVCIVVVLLIVPPAEEMRPPYNNNNNNHAEEDLTQAETETFEDENAEEEEKDDETKKDK